MLCCVGDEVVGVTGQAGTADDHQHLAGKPWCTCLILALHTIVVVLSRRHKEAHHIIHAPIRRM